LGYQDVLAQVECKAKQGPEAHWVHPHSFLARLGIKVGAARSTPAWAIPLDSIFLNSLVPFFVK
jgi:hypothetical protein